MECVYRIFGGIWYECAQEERRIHGGGVEVGGYAEDDEMNVYLSGTIY